jgi:hypothetical protein
VIVTPVFVAPSITVMLPKLVHDPQVMELNPKFAT